MKPPGKGSLLVIFLTVFIDLLGFGMVLPLLPIYSLHIAEQRGWREGEWQIGLVIGLLMSSFSLMQFLFAPLWGRLSDRIGRRPVLMVGLAGSVVFYTLFGLATVLQSLTLLFVSRIGAGIAGATISTASAYIADVTTLGNRTKGMALIGAAFGLGFTFGPLFGFLAVPDGKGDPGPGPGYAAAALSAVALLVAIFKLPESLTPGHAAQAEHGFTFSALRNALRVPSVGLVLLASFVCVFAFANFEPTLSVTLEDPTGPFRYDFKGVCLTFAFIGFVLLVVQGGIVRRLAGRVSDGRLAAGGTLAEIVGFLLMALACSRGSDRLLYAALTIVVTGFAFVTPSLNSLLSRRSDPAKQGGILGLGQSIASLARILGPMVGLPLVKSDALAAKLSTVPTVLPPVVASVMMAVGLGLVVAAARAGQDFPAEHLP